MNKEQLKHIAAALHAIALAQFAVFGYTALIAQPVAWVQLNRVQCDMRNFQFVFSSGEVNDISGDAV